MALLDVGSVIIADDGTYSGTGLAKAAFDLVVSQIVIDAGNMPPGLTLPQYKAFLYRAIAGTTGTTPGVNPGINATMPLHPQPSQRVSISELAGGIAANANYSVDGYGATTLIVGQPFIAAIPRLRHGLKIATIDLFMTPHGATTPAVAPTFAMFRVASAAGSALAATSCGPVGVFPLVLWNDAKVHRATFTPSGSPGTDPIDLATYFYTLSLTDESGAGSAVGNKYHAISINYVVVP